MTTLHNTGALTGRILLAALFIPAGISKIVGFEGTVGYIASVGLPLATLAAISAIVVELIAGLALLVGYRIKLAAVILAVFTLVATVLFHNFWAMPADQAYMQQLMFMKNIAVVGGLLMVAALGGGTWVLGANDKSAHVSS
ncbi:MAG: DoxX family protein [Burkholderiaceae bacterium]|jgi:putative oxidoreductase|tara:strand:- start:1019 stop:1441 length:423 start_codon:yes stop_codon:yes gene_type:complete